MAGSLHKGDGQGKAKAESFHEVGATEGLPVAGAGEAAAADGKKDGVYRPARPVEVRRAGAGAFAITFDPSIAGG